MDGPYRVAAFVPFRTEFFTISYSIVLSRNLTHVVSGVSQCSCVRSTGSAIIYILFEELVQTH
jgi:hypothetical protein